MNPFLSILHDMHQSGRAVAAINVFNLQTIKGVLAAAAKEDLPVILQPSSGTVKKIGASTLAGMLRGAIHNSGARAAIHLDHCRDEELALCCIQRGWDAVMMDFSHLPMQENIERTRAIVEKAHAAGVAVEGEVGTIVGVEEDIVADSSRLASYEETIAFIEATGVDAIAPAIGTAHGLYHDEPKLNFDLVEKIAAGATPLVVHGGTGLSDDVMRRLVRLGASKINISTALKHRYAQEIAALEQEMIEKNPLAADQQIQQGIEEMARRVLRLFALREV